MPLKDHLKRFRLALIKKDLIQSLWMSYAVLLIIFVFVIALESVFYFSPKVKSLMFGSILSLLGVWIVGLWLCTALIYKNSLNKFQVVFLHLFLMKFFQKYIYDIFLQLSTLIKSIKLF